MYRHKLLGKRGLSLFMAVMMCMSLVNFTVFATDGHVHKEDGWVCTQGDPVKTLTCDRHVHGEDCYKTERGEQTCTVEEHEHGEDCWETAEPELTCTEVEHTHTEDCFNEDGEQTCTLEEHEHGEDCYETAEPELACGKTEHTHGDGCYEAVTVKVCGEEDHEHGEDCYTVTEGAWTCIAPVVEEIPAEVQKFLSAVAGLPAVEDIDAVNAEAIGEQVNDVLDMYEGLIDAGLDEREDVTEALETVYAVFEAVLAAENIPEGSTFENGGSSRVVTSADSAAYPQTSRYNVCGDGWSDNWAETGYGQIELVGEGDVVTDDVFMHYYRGHNGVAYPLTYTNLAVESNSNPDAVRATVGQEGGHIKVQFEQLGTGAATIVIGYTCQNMKTTVGLATDSDWYCAVSGQLVYTVNGSDDSSVSVGRIGETEDWIDIDLGTGYWTIRNANGLKDSGYLPDSPVVSRYYYSNTASNPYGQTRVTYPGDLYLYSVENSDGTIATVDVGAADDWDTVDRNNNHRKGPLNTFTAYNVGTTDIVVTTVYDIVKYNYYYSYGWDGYNATDAYVHTYHVTVTDSSNDKITLTYHDGDDIIAQVTGEPGEYTIGQNLANKDGYVFKGWSDTEGGTTVVWEVGETYTFNTDTDLWAVWEKVQDDQKATYQIVREYWVDGKLKETVKIENLLGKVGDEIVGDELETRYGWKHYTLNGETAARDFTYDGSTPEKLVLTKDGPNTITLKYHVGTAPTPELKPLTVTKVASTETPTVGEEFTYTIKVHNPNSKAISVTITDKLNKKLDVVWDDENEMYGVSGGGVYDKDTHTVTWTDVAVDANGDKTVTVTVTANAAGEIKNTATVTWDDGSATGSETVTAKAKSTTYTVYHEYYTNGQRDDYTKGTDVDGTVGQVVKVSDLTKNTTYQGNTYGYTRAYQGTENKNHPDGYTYDKTNGVIDQLTLAESGNIIVLRYDRNFVTYTWSGLPEGHTEILPTGGIYAVGAGVTVDNSKYTNGKEVTVGGTTYVFSGWSTEDATITEGKFTMPAKNVKIEGTWRAKTPEKPEKPTHEDVRSLIGVPVTVVCDTEEKSNSSFGYHLNDAQKARVTIGEVQESNGVYTCGVTFIAQKFCDAYNGLSSVTANHKLADGQGNVTLTLTWDAENNKWELPADFIAPVTIHVVCEPVKAPKIVVDKTNDGLKLDENTGTLKVNYTVKVTNKSGFDLYGLRLTDVMDDPILTKVNAGDVGDPSVKLTFSNWKVGGADAKLISTSEDDLTHVLQLIDRDKLFEDEETVTLTYSVEVESLNDEGAVKVELHNVAEGASWSKPLSSPATVANVLRAAIMPLADALDDEPDVTGSDGSSASTDGDAPDVTDKDDSSTGGTTGGDSGTEGVIPRKYTVTYKWNLPAGATGKTLPEEAKYLAGKPVTVDTDNKKDDIVTVGDKTYKFSGWDKEDFNMPAENVVIEGTWTPETDDSDKEYTVTYEWNLPAGATGKTLPGEAKYLEGKPVTVDTANKKDDIVTVDGKTYKFSGWDKEDFTMPAGNVVIKGTWEEVIVTPPDPEQVTLTLSYDANGGINAPASESKTVDEGASADFTVKGRESMTRSGYTFQGWATSADGAVAYRAGSSISISENTTLYAVWSRNTIVVPDPDPVTRYTLTINYVYEDGTTAAPTHSSRHDSGYRYSVSSPSIEGYTPDQAVVSGTLTSDVTVTVVYTADGANIPDENPPLAELPDENPPLSENPEVNIPDENPPLAENPEVDIPDENPPLAENPEVDIPDEDVPLDATPKTGDDSHTGLWAGLCVVSLLGAVALGRKEEDERA